MEISMSTPYQELMKDVSVVKQYVHDRSDVEIFAYLEAHYNDYNRVENVIKELRANDETVSLLKEKENNENNEENVLRNLNKNCNIDELPEIDVDEIELVLNDLIEIENGWNSNQLFQPACSTQNSNQNGSTCSPSTSTSGLNTNEFHDKQVKTLVEIFPDGDPDYFSRFVQENCNNIKFINQTVDKWLQQCDYKKKEEKKFNNNRKRKFSQRNYTIEEFLEMFPDPESYFNNPERAVTVNYENHVKIYVINTYPPTNDYYVTHVLVKHKYHLTPVVRELNENLENKAIKSHLTHIVWDVIQSREEPPLKMCNGDETNSEKIEMPEVVDDLFYKELAYLELADEIKEYQKEKIEGKKKRFEDAKSTGTLMTCECCFEDELLLEDMFPCPKDHLFCKDCIRRQAEINIGINKFQFPCFDGYCIEQFSTKVLQRCMNSNMFSILCRKLQEEEIRKAKIPDLESCPFCSFSAIMPNVNDKIFKCLNPECLKESCRLCKEVNHVPLRCNEVEKKSEVGMRTYIENKMTDALLRTCPKCFCRFVKDSGCNSMRCTCGQMMCYVCRKPIADYSHFERNANKKSGKCPISSNDSEVNRKEVQTSAQKAREEYIRMHPDLANVKLKHDPTKNLQITHLWQSNREMLKFGRQFATKPVITDLQERLNQLNKRCEMVQKENMERSLPVLNENMLGHILENTLPNDRNANPIPQGPWMTPVQYNGRPRFLIQNDKRLQDYRKKLSSITRFLKNTPAAAPQFQHHFGQRLIAQNNNNITNQATTQPTKTTPSNSNFTTVRNTSYTPFNKNLTSDSTFAPRRCKKIARRVANLNVRPFITMFPQKNSSEPSGENNNNSFHQLTSVANVKSVSANATSTRTPNININSTYHLPPVTNYNPGSANANATYTSLEQMQTQNFTQNFNQNCRFSVQNTNSTRNSFSTYPIEKPLEFSIGNFQSGSNETVRNLGFQMQPEQNNRLNSDQIRVMENQKVVRGQLVGGKYIQSVATSTTQTGNLNAFVEQNDSVRASLDPLYDFSDLFEDDYFSVPVGVSKDNKIASTSSRASSSKEHGTT